MIPYKPLTVRVVLDQKLCSGCGFCVEACMHEVLSMDPITKKAEMLNIDLCLGCPDCISVCIEGALELTRNAQPDEQKP